MRKLWSAAAAAVFVATTGLSVGAFVAPAQAKVCSTKPWYVFKDVEKSRRMSNLRSDYLRGPGTISYTRTKTAEVNAAMTSEVSAEAGVVFAKASTSIGVSVGRSWSKSGQWSYTKKVPRGTTARLVMWHSSRRFVVIKKQNVYPCTTAVVYRARVNAPVAANINVWGLDRR